MHVHRDLAFLFSAVIGPILILSLEVLLYRWFRTRLRVRGGVPGTGSARTLNVLRVLFLLFGGALLLGGILRADVRSFPPWLLVGGFYPFLLWHASLLLFGFGILLWMVGRLILRGLAKVVTLIPPVRRRTDALLLHPGYQRFDASRRLFLRRGALGLAGVTVAGTAYGMLIGRNGYEITTTEFFIPGLPPEFDRFVIGLVSDVHSGIYMLPDQMKEYVRVVNGLGADMIVIPGDFVNGRVDEVHPFAEAFGELRAPSGVFGVLGNHDFYSGDPDAVAEEIGKSGIRILRDVSLPIARGNSRIRLAGVDDVGRNDRAKVRLDLALPAAEKEDPTILLCHRPYYLAQAAAKNVALVLSGHTHGGQIVFGRFGNAFLTPAAFASEYVWGKYALGKTQMYVTRGIGTVGIPVRINCPPEISRIILRCA